MSSMMNIIHRLKPLMLMLVNQVLFAGLNVMYKLAANDGMKLRILIVYRFLFATAIMIPLALILERKRWKKINRMVILYAILCGFFGGALGQNLYVQSLVYTSATFVSAMINLAPAFTFILAIFFKLEKMNLGSTAGKAKVLGTLIGIGGATVFTFYRGPQVVIWSTNIDVLQNHRLVSPSPSKHTDKFVLGAFLGFLSCVCMSLWLIIQAKMSLIFPYLTSSTALMCLMGSIQAAIIAVCAERDWNQWKLGWNVRLLAAVYAGVMGSALMVYLVSWGIRLKGPLYASIFNPVGLLFVAIIGSLILDEKLHVGSIIGGILIVCGLYLVLWGKAKELRRISQLMPAAANEDKDKIRELMAAAANEDKVREEDDDQTENKKSDDYQTENNESVREAKPQVETQVTVESGYHYC